MLIPLVLLGCTGEIPEECAEPDKITVYADNDNDEYGAPETAKLVCPPLDADGVPTGEIPRGFSANDDDCDDFRAELNPGQIELCDGFDNDCDTTADEGLRQISFFLDADGDGFGDPDLARSTSSCAAPPGFVDNNLDCNDENAAIHPDAIEICDGGVDNNCNDDIDDGDILLDESSAPVWYLDDDGDSYGDPDEGVPSCLQPDQVHVANADDCADYDPLVNPGIQEVCNRYDDDCDQLIDDSDPDIDPLTQTTWIADDDADGYGDPDTTTLACFQPWFYLPATAPEDCDDTEPLLGDPAPWLLDGDGDGFGAGAPSAPACDPPTPDHVLQIVGLDCDDSNPFTSPLGNEVCDSGVDNDCDTLIDDLDDSLDPAFSFTFYEDADLDTYGNPDSSIQGCTPAPGYVEDDQDCNDGSDLIQPTATEECDGADNDCDGLIDDEDPDVDLGSAGTYYADFDLDGFGDPNLSVESCARPATYVDNDLDCDDTDPNALVFGPWLADVDGDGVGAGAGSPDSCTAPSAGDVPSYFGTDCAPNDPDRFPGNAEICNNGIDEDCQGGDLACITAVARGIELDLDVRDLGADGLEVEAVDLGAGEAPSPR